MRMGQLYKIEDLAEAAGTDVMAVRYYIKVGLIAPVKTVRCSLSNGLNERVGDKFDEATLKRLKTIRKLRKSGATMDDIYIMLREEY